MTAFRHLRRAGLQLPTTLIVLLLSACSGGGSGDDGAGGVTPPQTPTPVPPTGKTLFDTAPAGDAFYQPPQPLPGVNGDVLWAEAMSPAANGKVWKVLYRSTSFHGDPIVVSGWIAIPDSAPPAGGYPVLAFAHGTTGISDACAPTVSSTPHDTITLLEEFLARGYVVSATDYQGLGTPGLHQYVVGPTEARSVLDSARAARNFGGGGKDTVLFGHSQGGHAVIYANELAAAYAPELDIIGTMATSAAVFDSAGEQLEALKNSRFKGFVVMTALAQNAAYGDTESPLERWLTSEGKRQADTMVRDSLCAGDLISIYSQFEASELFVPGSPLPLTSNRYDADADSMPEFRIGSSPLLLVHGSFDPLILPGPVVSWVEENCANRQDLYLEWFDTNHFIPDEAPEQLETVVFDWIDGRFAGQTAPSVCNNVPRPR